VSPAAGEHCSDGSDNNCDGRIDELDPLCPSGCSDGDGDGYLDDTCGGSDCDDTSPGIHPGALESCIDGRDNDCNGQIDGDDPACPAGCNDTDGDGFFDEACGGQDCDDSNRAIFPGAGEHCQNGIDDDCNELADAQDPLCPADCADADSDGYYDTACGGSDCDDASSSVHPGAGEHCSDGADNDCDGFVDAEDSTDCPAACMPFDVDMDGYPDLSCGGSDCDDNNAQVNPGRVEAPCDGTDNDCNPATVDDSDDADDDGDGFTRGCGADCDDQNPYVHVEAFERCDDTLDNNCDGLTDGEDGDTCPSQCTDADGDGYLDVACGGSDCDDSDFGTHPGAGEHCSDGRDNNCDGDVDEDDLACPPGCEDADADGYRDHACGGSDCDDTDPTKHPGAGEHCYDGLDNDCNGLIDGDDAGGCPSGCVDADGDGYFDVACGGSDCDDALETAFPAAVELCDGVDNDCNGEYDEGFADTDTDGIADCVDPDADGNGWVDGIGMSGGGCLCSHKAGRGSLAWLMLLALVATRRRGERYR
jgi:hypothetical protein